MLGMYADSLGLFDLMVWDLEIKYLGKQEKAYVCIAGSSGE